MIQLDSKETNSCQACPDQGILFLHQLMEDSIMSMMITVSPCCHGPTGPPHALGIGQMRIHPLCRVQKPGAQQFGSVLSIVLAAREEPSVAQRDYLRMLARRGQHWQKLSRVQ